MKDKLKSIVMNGLPYGLVFFILSLILGCFVAHYSMRQSLQVSVIMGLLALFANGFFYNRFAKPLKILEKISVAIAATETIIIQSPANYKIDEELVPGKLVLTNTRLIFKSFSDEENEEFEYHWYFNTLKVENFYGSFWNRGGQFILKTNNENLLIFEVHKLSEWKDTFHHTKLN